MYYEIITFAQTPGKLAAWIDLLKKLRIKSFVIVDGDDEEENYLRQAVERGLEQGRYAFRLSREDILCYVPGKIVAKILAEVFSDIQKKLSNNQVNRFNELIDEIRLSDEWCIESFRNIVSLIFDSLDEEKKKQYGNKGKFERWPKTQIASIIIDKELLDDTPPEVKQILQVIDKNIIEV